MQFRVARRHGYRSIRCHALTTMIVLATVCFPARASEHSQVISDTIEQVIQPAFKVFLPSVERLQNAVQADCQSVLAREALAAAVRHFSLVEGYRLGPMNQQNRAERLFFWPDRRGTGQKQLNRLLADPNRLVLNVEALGKKSVALQGFPALERIVMSHSSTDSVADCAVAQAIAGNLVAIANEVQDGWLDERGITLQLTSPRSDGTFRTSGEAVSALLTMADDVLDVLKEKKVALLIKSLIDSQSMPASAPFYRSGLTWANLQGNLSSVVNLLTIAGLAPSGGLRNRIAFEANTASNMLDAAQQSLSDGDIDIATRRLRAYQMAVASIRDMLKSDVARHWDVSTGFNAGDGD